MKSYPLLQSQLGVFYDCLKYPKVMQYNIPCITKLTDDIDLDRVEKAIQAIFEPAYLPLRANIRPFSFSVPHCCEGANGVI